MMWVQHVIVRATYTPRPHEGVAPLSGRVTLSVSIRQGLGDVPLQLLTVRDQLQRFLRDSIKGYADPHDVDPLSLATSAALHMEVEYPGRIWQSHVHMARGLGAVVTTQES